MYPFHIDPLLAPRLAPDPPPPIESERWWSELARREARARHGRRSVRVSRRWSAAPAPEPIGIERWTA